MKHYIRRSGLKFPFARSAIIGLVREPYQIAALTPKEQGLLLETNDSEQAPSLSQAQRMKKLSQSGELNEDTMLSITIVSCLSMRG